MNRIIRHPARLASISINTYSHADGVTYVVVLPRMTARDAVRRRFAWRAGVALLLNDLYPYAPGMRIFIIAGLRTRGLLFERRKTGHKITLSTRRRGDIWYALAASSLAYIGTT